MGYNRQKLEMKKIVIVLIAMIGFAFAAKAQDGSGSCKLPGTYEYVNVDYYAAGHLTITNSSGVDIHQLRITVTYTDSKGNTKTLCNKTFYGSPAFAANMTSETTDGVQKCSSCDGGTFKVTVGNPICQ